MAIIGEYDDVVSLLVEAGAQALAIENVSFG